MNYSNDTLVIDGNIVNKEVLKILLKNENVIFYPGAGSDTNIINHFVNNKEASVFLYSDYNKNNCNYLNSLERSLNTNYKFLAKYNFDIDNKILDQYQKHLNSNPKLALMNNDKDFQIDLYFYETNDHFNFAVIYINMDALFIYKNMFTKDNINLYAMYIKPMGFGGEYTDFGKNTEFEKIAIEKDFFPKYMITHQENYSWGAWNYYEQINNNVKIQNDCSFDTFYYKFNESLKNKN